MARVFSPLFIETAAIHGDRYSERQFTFDGGAVTLKMGKLKREGEDADYYTYELSDSLFCNDELKDALSSRVAESLSELLKKNGYKKGGRILVAALGNERMTADSLGAATAGGLHITRHLIDAGARFKRYASISAIKSSVSGVTGLASFDIISGVADRTKPDYIIAVDTLSCRSVTRLGRAVQLSDDGIEPGSGVNNTKTKLSRQSLGIPVIAIGVPLVIYVKDIIKEYVVRSDGTEVRADELLYNLIVAEKEIDVTVEDFAEVLARSINAAANGG